MNDKTIKKKIALLRSMEPDRNTVRSIHEQVFPRSYREKQKWLPLPVLVPLVAITGVIVLVVFAVSVFIPRFFDQTITYAKIAIAPDQYEKAQIAFAYEISQISAMQKKTPHDIDISSLSQSLALANEEMNGLTLKGEKGKYTAQQCLELYTAYYDSLGRVKKELMRGDNAQKKSLLFQINQYDEQAEKKLHKYKE